MTMLTSLDLIRRVPLFSMLTDAQAVTVADGEALLAGVADTLGVAAGVSVGVALARAGSTARLGAFWGVACTVLCSLEPPNRLDSTHQSRDRATRAATTTDARRIQ